MPPTNVNDASPTLPTVESEPAFVLPEDVQRAQAPLPVEKAESESPVMAFSMRPISLSSLLLLVWSFGVVVLLARALLERCLLMRTLRRSIEVTDQGTLAMMQSIAKDHGIREASLLCSESLQVPVAIGVLRPAIVLPVGYGKWSDDRLQIVLLHEMMHIGRADVLAQSVARLACTLFWFNPLVWIACRRLRQESEYACDDVVLRAGVEATDYATHLFDVAKRLSGRQTVWASAPAIANPSTLERRVVAMLQHHKNRQPLTRGGWILAAVFALAVSLPLAAVGLAPQSNAGADSPMAAPAPPAIPNATPDEGARPAQASLSGVVQDQTGGRMPGVTVTVTNQQTQEPYVSVTNAPGSFQFGNLPPATYELVAQLSGFRRVTMPIDLSTGTPTTLTLTLPIGALSEAVTVRCEARSPSILQVFFPTLSAQERPAAPIRVGGSVRPPRKSRHANPVCPAGRVTDDVVVILEGHIGVDGLVTDITSLRSDEAVPAEFAESAKDAVQQWEFTPTLLNNVPVEVTITVTVVCTGG